MASTPTRLIGKTFTRLTVIEWSKPYWVCRCTCGNIVYHPSYRLTSGNTKSCGCLRNDTVAKLKYRHGQAAGNRTAEYTTWKRINQRCYDPHDPSYNNYGGRGIKNFWQHDFEGFFKEIGKKPSPLHSIDRIDNNKDYEPGNCRWASRAEQARNHRRNRLITYKDETKCIADWAIHLNIPYQKLYHRLVKGAAIGDLVLQHSAQRLITYNGKTQCLAHWAKDIGISRKALSRRLDSGLPMDVIIHMPKKLKPGPKHKI